MAILEFKGAIQEFSGAPKLEAARGTTVDESLRYLNDNGYFGIYDPIAKEVSDGKCLVFDADTGKQIGLSEHYEEKAVLVPRQVGGNGGGGAVWTLINSTNYTGQYVGLSCEVLPAAAPGSYVSWPHEGSTRWRFMVYSGAWTTVATWDHPRQTYAGYVQMGREGFTAQTARIDNFSLYESVDNTVFAPLPAVSNYGTTPTDTNNTSYYTGVRYPGTGRVSDLAVQ